jgi:serine/threonine-protein kinase
MHPVDPRIHALRDTLTGQVLRGTGNAQYHLRERIGEGGQGWVFKAAWDEPGGFAVIVKVLRPDSVTREALSRFQREAEVLRMLAQQQRPNPHIVRFFDHASAAIVPRGYSETITLPFTVLEYVHGPTLEQVLARSRGQGLPVERVRRLLRHVVLALEGVHAQKVVHRDLKPSNILLAQEQGTEIAKVTDFGLVKLVDMNLQKTTALAGASLGYAPPEQYEQGNQRVSPRTDVFSTAAIAFEMLAGRAAFPYKEGENPLLIVTRILNGPRPSLAKNPGSLPAELQARPEIVERLDVEIARATSSDPQDRHESVTELWNALDPMFRALGDMRRSYTPSPISSAPSFSQVSSREPSPVAASGPVSAREAMSKPPESLSGNPSAWRWQLRARPIRPGAVRAATFVHGGEVAVAVGASGVARWDAKGWTIVPSALDPGQVRGVSTLGGELLLFGERALVVRMAPSGAHQIWPVPDQDVTFLGAHCDEGGMVTLVGERPSRAVAARGVGVTTGTLAQMEAGRITLMSDAPQAVRLRAATRLRSGTLIACGDWGALVRLELGVAEHVGAVCGGHLTAIAATPEGGALTVGAGGHALSISPRLEAQLEAVQTTRDLLCLSIADDGAAWAGAVQARLLRRSNQSWVRMSGDVGVSASVVAIWAGMRAVRAICDDGSVIEGVLG